MSDFKNSKTAANLAYAFAGESQARNKYTYFAGVARKEGYEQIAAIFEQTANNEKEHAKVWFKELGWLGNTPENLYIQSLELDGKPLDTIQLPFADVVDGGTLKVNLSSVPSGTLVK